MSLQVYCSSFYLPTCIKIYASKETVPCFLITHDMGISLQVWTEIAFACLFSFLSLTCLFLIFGLKCFCLLDHFICLDVCRLWGTFLADVVIQMLGTDYARILRAIYAFAQVLTLLLHFGSFPRDYVRCWSVLTRRHPHALAWSCCRLWVCCIH